MSEANGAPAPDIARDKAKFDAFYEKEVLPWLADETKGQEAARSAMKKRVPFLLGVLLLGAALVIADWLGDLGTALHGVVIWVIAGVGFLIAMVGRWTMKPATDWNRNFRPVFLGKVLSYFGWTYTYQTPEGFLQPFRDVRIVPRWDRKTMTDHVVGKIDNEIDAELSDCHLMQRRDDDDGAHYDTVFHGLVGSFTFPKKFEGQTVILADKSSFARFFDGAVQEGDRVHLEEAPDFDRKYAVYSTDQVEARYLLTPAFMERFLQLSDIFNRGRRQTRIEAAFVDSRFYLTINEHHDHFRSLNISSKLEDPASVDPVIQPIFQIFDLVDTLRLNQKTHV